MANLTDFFPEAAGGGGLTLLSSKTNADLIATNYATNENCLYLPLDPHDVPAGGYRIELELAHTAGFTAGQSYLDFNQTAPGDPYNDWNWGGSWTIASHEQNQATGSFSGTSAYFSPLTNSGATLQMARVTFDVKIVPDAFGDTVDQVCTSFKSSNRIVTTGLFHEGWGAQIYDEAMTNNNDGSLTNVGFFFGCQIGGSYDLRTIDHMSMKVYAVA